MKLRKIYKTIRKISPTPINSQLSKLVFKFSGKPFVRKDNIDSSLKFSGKERGGLILSADFEMAWAWRYARSGDDPLKKGRLERENFPAIIKCFEKYDIPITFATVGHLFLETCKRTDHDWMRRIPPFVNKNWEFLKGDWFVHDPCSSYTDDPEWYAPDLIQMILDSKVNHEVGSHSFSHIDFSDKNCPREVANDEIIACKQAAAPYGISLESMVFPGGTWGNIEVLKNHDFKIYRKRCDFEIAYPHRDGQGLLVSASSGCLEHNLAYGWNADYFVDRLKKYITKAIQTHTIAHLWFHPSLDPYFLENIFPKFLGFAADQREKGHLWIGSMRQIAAHINENRVL